MSEKIAEPKRTYEIVINYIKNELAAGVYAEGDKLPPERELADTLNVSRNSVREAMRVLEILGAVTSQQGAGNYITNRFENTFIEMMTLMHLLQRANYKDIADYRYGLEFQAIKLAIDNASEEQLRKLRTYVDAMENTSEGEYKVAQEKSIHYTIAEASGNAFIASSLRALSQIMDKFVADMRAKILAVPGNKIRLQQSHIQMVEAISEKNLEKGRRALDEHFKCIYENLEK